VRWCDTAVGAKAAACRTSIRRSTGFVRQQGGNFADYGAALQKLDDAVAKYQNAK